MGLNKVFASYAASAMLGISAGSVLWGIDDVRRTEAAATSCEVKTWNGEACSPAELWAYNQHISSQRGIFEGLKAIFFGVVIGGGAAGAVAVRNQIKRKSAVGL